MPYQNIWLLNLEGVWPEADPFFWFIQPQKKEFPVRVLNIRAAARLGDKKYEVDVFPLWITFFRDGQEDVAALNPGSPVAQDLMGQLRKWAKKLGSSQKELAGDIGEVGSLVDLASES